MGNAPHAAITTTFLVMPDPLQPIRGISDFWDRIASARSRLLALDYDGTLAPFQRSRMEARPLPGSLDTLQAIRQCTDTQVAVVSGRLLSELRQLVGSLPVYLIGSHGCEWRDPDGSGGAASLAAPERLALAEGQKRAQQAEYGDYLEMKIGSVAIHTRGLPDATYIEQRIEDMWQPLAERFPLKVRHFNGGIELRVHGCNKGTALTELRQRANPESLVVYVGDDETDEDAFRAAAPIGFGIRVGDAVVPSAATGRLADSTEVLRFLRSWHYATTQGKGGDSSPVSKNVSS